MRRARLLGVFVKILPVLSFLVLSQVALGLAWEDSDEAKSFESGDLETVKRILTYNKYGSELQIMALERAIGSGKVELVKYLVSLGWLTQCPDRERCNYIHVAAGQGNVEMIRYLISEGFKGNGYAMKAAAEHGHYKATEVLLSNRVEPDAGALSIAATRGDMKLVSLLCRAGANPESASNAMKDQILHSPLSEDERTEKRKMLEYLEGGRCKPASNDKAH